MWTNSPIHTKIDSLPSTISFMVQLLSPLGGHFGWLFDKIRSFKVKIRLSDMWEWIILDLTMLLGILYKLEKRRRWLFESKPIYFTMALRMVLWFEPCLQGLTRIHGPFGAPTGPPWFKTYSVWLHHGPGTVLVCLWSGFCDNGRSWSDMPWHLSMPDFLIF